MTPCLLRAGLLVMLLSLLGPAPAARAEGDLPSEIKKVATKVHTFLKGQGEEAIRVGQFTGPANFPTSAGPGVQQLLAEELAKLGVAVKKRAKLGISGKYTGAEVDDPTGTVGAKRFAVALTGEIVDGLGKRYLNFDFEVHVTNEQAMVQMLGVSVDLPQKATDGQRRQGIKKAFLSPQAATAGTVALTAPGSPFGTELLIDGQPVAPQSQDDIAFVPVKRHQTFVVRLHNNSDYEVGVALTIDGLSVFQFADPDAQGRKPEFKFVFVGPGRHADVNGWFRKPGESFAFEVVALPKSAAAELNQLNDVGTVTAVFRASWEGTNKPADERPTRLAAGDGVGIGPPVKNDLKPVSRTVGSVRGSVSVRYTKGPG